MATQRNVSKGTGSGLLKQAAGMFLLGLCIELGAIPKNIGPYATMALVFTFSEVSRYLLTPKMWKEILGK